MVKHADDEAPAIKFEFDIAESNNVSKRLLTNIYGPLNLTIAL